MNILALNFFFPEDFKRDYVFWHATTNVRLMELGATTLLISLLSWKGKKQIKMFFIKSFFYL